MRAAFDQVLGHRPNQLDRQRPDLDVVAADLLDISSATGEVTLAGLRANVEVAIRYLGSWLRERRRGHPQPHGGRGDGGDLALAGVAVGPQRHGLTDGTR